MIHVPAGTYILARQDVNDDGGDGDLDVTDTLRVIGDGPDLTIVDANHASRIFEVSGRRRVVLSNIRLRNGEASAGGALLAMAPIVLKRVVVETSHASTVGGGIVAAAGLRMLGSSVFDNAGWIAPGLAVSGGRARIRDSTFARNAVDDGGPSFGHGDVLAIGPGRVIIVNCTIAGEIGNLGYCDPPPVPSCVAPSDIVLANVTVDVVSFAQLALGGSYTVRNSIIGSCRTSLLSEGHLLIGDSRRCSVSGDMTGVTTDVDPMLDQLADNGGSTLTRMPLAGSPAIDAGSPAVPGTGGQSCAPRDQRGIARPIGRRCDLGAVEAGP
ncbi:MAG TPA: choice-of-anchor Q domain-containing protein [Gemmatimonadaceae bacterium]|nr:choice-of-anchor Q domain-containing protein [Gemmatimonadaceae bacterium]